jgi:uroporphyrinogen-III synthase
MTAPLTGLRVVAFEARRAEELATMLGRQGAKVLSAPALRETPLADSPDAVAFADALERGDVDAVVLQTGVGTRALAAVVAGTHPRFVDALGRTRIVARGPKPLAVLRDLGVGSAHPVDPPFTWHETLAAVDRLGLGRGARVAVQEYGRPATALVAGLANRGLSVLRVPVYRWALPADTAPLVDAVRRLVAGDVDVAVFTNAAQVEHLFRVAPDPQTLPHALVPVVVASVGPVCSEALEAHGVAVDLEASPPKMGPLVATIAARASALLARKRAAQT